MASNSADGSQEADISAWVQAVNAYVTETDASSLDLHSREIETVRSVLVHLQDSHITHLNLEGVNLSGGMKNLADSLVALKIKKLNIRSCNLTDEDLSTFMSILKKIQITKLDISKNHLQLDEKVVKEFVSYLHQSQLTDLNFGTNSFDPEVGGLPLTKELPNTLLTHLNLSSASLTHDALIALFSNLPNSAIMNLNLSDNQITHDELDALRVSLKSSKLKVLDLSDNNIDDIGVNVLLEGLIHSEIEVLNLNRNDFHGSNTLGEYLKDTQIKFLNLGNNRIEERAMFSDPDFLRNSSLITLDVGGCSLSEDISQELIRGLKNSKIIKFIIRKNVLQLQSFSEFANIVKHSEITYVDFSENCLSDAEFVSLGNCLKRSKIKFLDVSNNFKHPLSETVLAQFIYVTENSGVQSLKMNGNKLLSHGAQTIAQSLSRESRFGLSSYWIEAITHLDLSNNQIEDEGAEALAENLKHSRIVSLNISTNSITDRGAKALAMELKGSTLLELKLEENGIENPGLEALAKGVEDTFITVLNVKNNPGDRILRVDSVLWKNRKETQKLINCFKRITPTARDGSIDFRQNVTSANIETFLEDCLHVYKAIQKEPKAMNVFLHSKTVSFSKSQFMIFLDEFPGQFVILFSYIVAGVNFLVNFLRKVEEMELTWLLTRFLSNRQILYKYMIDKTDNILHPYVYKLLAKYKPPLYHLEIKPGRKEKITKYFEEHPNIEGGSDVIKMFSLSQ